MSSQDVQYRGYWIRHNPLTGYWWVEKDGHHICSPRSLEDAKKEIDNLLKV